MTIGDLISGLVDVYERRYDDHELATVKAALVMDALLQSTRPVRAARAARAARVMRATRGNARKAA